MGRIPYFKLNVHVLRHPKMQVIARDPELWSLWTKLGITAIERRAQLSGDTFEVDERELMVLACKNRRDSAERLLDKLATTERLVANKSGTTWTIAFRNLAKRQGSPKNSRTEGVPPTKHETRSTKHEGDSTSRTPPSGGDGVARSPRPKKQAEAFPDDVRAVCREMQSAIAAVWPGHSKPTKSAQLGWLADMDKLLRIGPIGGEPATVEQVRFIVGALFDPKTDSEVAEFWRANVRSPRKLRKHWEEIVIKFQQEQTRSTPDDRRQKAAKTRRAEILQRAKAANWRPGDD